MSGKRGAETQLTKDDFNSLGMSGRDDTDPVQRATAAQLASRKIKAAKGLRRTGAAAPRPATSFGPPSTTSQTSLFTNGSQSFPPTNGASSNGNGSPNVSFGGFGSGGGGGTGFDFSAPAAVNNPFANPSANTGNGASSGGGFGFNFGQSQPAASQAPSSGIFSFQGSQQPASQPSASLFPAAPSPAPSTGMFGAPASGSNTFGAPISSAAPGASLFGSTNGNSAFGTTPGGSIFGSAPSTIQQPAGGSLFGQPLGQNASPTPFKSFFGGPAEGAKSAFGQPVDDAMSTSPDNSPSRGESKAVTNHWNKPLETIANGTSNSSSSNDGDSPDHPHIEEEKNTPNPFASIPRPPPEAPKIAEKPTKPAPQAEEESPHIEEERSTPNPFASIARPAQSAPKLAESQPKTNLFHTSTPTSPGSLNLGKPNTQAIPSFTPTVQATSSQSTSIFGQKSAFGGTSSSTPKADSIFKPAAQPSQTFQGNMGSAASTTTPTQSAPSPDATTVAHLQETGTVLPNDRITDTSKYLSTEIRDFVFSEENIQAPTSDSGLTEEEIKYSMREQKLARLNNSYKTYFANLGGNRGFSHQDLRPMMANYIALYEELMAPIEGPLTNLIATHGKEQGTRLFHQQSGRIPDESGKRRPGDDVPRSDEDVKKSRTDAASSQSTPQFASSSETANKFMSFLGQSDKSTPSSQPSSSLFNRVTENDEKSLNGTTPTQPSAASVSASGFKMPTFGTGTPTNFMSQFGQSAAKTAAEAKQKAKDEDFDSDEDDPVEWDRKYEEEQAAKKAKLQEEQARLKPTFIPGKGFTFGDPAPSQSSSNVPALTNGANGGIFSQLQSSSLVPPSTNGGLFSSRSVSPAASTTGGASVFDSLRPGTPSAGNNIFGHLSDRGSDVEGSAKGDADDEGSDEEADSQQSKGADPPSDRSSGRFGGFSESDDVQSDTPTAGRSLFDRIQKPTEASAEQSGAVTPSSGLFGRVSQDDTSDRTPLSTTAANEGGLFGFGTSKTSTAGDQTWKPNSPIKFGGGDGAPPKFSFAPATPTKETPNTLFGSTSKTSGFQFSPIGSTTPVGSTTPKDGSIFGSTTPAGSSTPKAGSLFGFSTSKPSSSLFPPTASSSVFNSGASSRATTPGASDISGAESTAGEQEDTGNDEQSDLVGMVEDKKGHDVLFESHHVKACRHEPDEASRKDKNNPWPVQGLGPIAVLKDQSTGVTKILMKKVPGGGIVINTRLMPQTRYERPGDKGKRGRFMTIDPESKKPLTWLVQFPSDEEAAAFVKACEGNKSQ